METKLRGRAKTSGSKRSPQSDTVANELQESCLRPVLDVLQLKLQQRRSREDLVKQGIMPPLKSSAAFHEQRRSLERARTEDYLKRKIRSRPERSDLIRMHILEETSAEPSLQAKQLQLKRSRLADDLNDKISHRPGPMELIHKNILPVHSSIKQAIIETQYPKALGDNSSCDEDSNFSLSPEEPVNQESPVGLLPPPLSPPATLGGSSIPSPTQAPPLAPPIPPTSQPSLKLTNAIATLSIQRSNAVSQIKSKPNSDRSAQRHRKAKDNKPKIKKLKYHQYIPPDQKGDKEPPPHLDSSYAKVLQQQQLLLQLQILNQQHYNYHAILPAPPKLPADQQPSSSSSPQSLTAVSNLGAHSHQSCAPLCGTKPTSLPPNLDEMKVADLRSELKLRCLPISGTKSDLIERLRNYQELNGGSDITSSSTAGGTTRPGAEGTGRASKTAATSSNNNNVSQQTEQQTQLQCLQTSSLTRQTAAAPPAEATQQHPAMCSDGIHSKSVSITLSDHSQGARSPEHGDLSSDTLGETKHHQVSSAAARVMTMDKDKMLQEKDKQIEELSRLLRQKQRLVELLKMQLECRKSKGQLPQPLVLLKVEQEAPDKPSISLSSGLQPLPHLPPSFSCDMDVPVKHEATEAEEALPNRLGLVQSSSQTQSEKMSTQTKEQYTCPSQTQQWAIEKLLLQQQRRIPNQQRTVQSCCQLQENQQHLQKLSQQRKKKSHKQQLKQQPQEQQKQSKQQHPQQTQVKPNILLKQQKSFFQQQMKQQQHVLLQTRMQLKKQQALTQQKQQEQPQSIQESQVNQQSGSCPSLPLELLNSNSTPTLVTDGNGNHFVIALTSHVIESQRTNVPDKTTNQIPLQSAPATLPGHKLDDQTKPKVNVGLLSRQNTKVCVDHPQRGVSHRQSAPPNLQPFSLKDQVTPPLGDNAVSLSSQIETCPGLDVLFSPPASVKTTASSPHNEEHEEDCIDIILQTGETSSTFNPNPLVSSHPPSPLQLLPSCDSLDSEKPEFQTLFCSTEEKHHLGRAGCGRLEDFLESTTGKPLLGVEPGALLTLIDDLHSQMLCTPSTLDHPPSPMDTNDMAMEGDHGLDGMDWLDLTMGGVRGQETPSLALLGPQTPTSVFSTDFLDSCDLQIHWDPCL